MRAIAPLALVLGLAACQTDGQSAASLPPRCQTALAALQQQDQTLKATLASGATLAKKQANARLIAANMQTGMGNANAACSSDVTRVVKTEVSSRLAQIETFLATGKWTGPVAG